MLIKVIPKNGIKNYLTRSEIFVENEGIKKGDQN